MKRSDDDDPRWARLPGMAFRRWLGLYGATLFFMILALPCIASFALGRPPTGGQLGLAFVFGATSLVAGALFAPIRVRRPWIAVQATVLGFLAIQMIWAILSGF